VKQGVLPKAQWLVVQRDKALRTGKLTALPVSESAQPGLSPPGHALRPAWGIEFDDLSLGQGAEIAEN